MCAGVCAPAAKRAKTEPARMRVSVPSLFLTPTTSRPPPADYDDVAFEPVDAAEMRDATLAAAADAAEAEVRRVGVRGGGGGRFAAGCDAG